MAALHLCVVMRLNVTDGRKVCMSHNEDTVITLPKPPSWFCLPVYLWPRFFFFHNRFYSIAFICMGWERRDEPRAGSHLVTSWLNNVNLQPDIIARCWMCFRKPLCKCLSSSVVNHNERTYVHSLQGPRQYNEMMRKTLGQRMGNTPKSLIVRFAQHCVLLSLHAAKFKEKEMPTVMRVEICWFVFSNLLLIEQHASVWCKCSGDSASTVVVCWRMKKQKGSDYCLYWQKDKCCYPAAAWKQFSLPTGFGNWKLRFFWTLPSRSSNMLVVVRVLSCLSPSDPQEPDRRRVTWLIKCKGFFPSCPKWNWKVSGSRERPTRYQGGFLARFGSSSSTAESANRTNKVSSMKNQANH